jgi:peptidoglycan hydrolase-like protein with peptidoglycan-binding domain
LIEPPPEVEVSRLRLNRHGFSKQDHWKILRSGRNKPVRVLILALSVLGIVVSSDVAKSGPSTTDRYTLASVDPAAFADEATQETEDQIGLDRGKRRDVQRRLTGLGFDTKVNGRFDEPTRAVITRWQAAHGFPKTGFLSTLQHQALLSESASATPASLSSSDGTHRRGGGSARHHRGGGGPGGVIGGVVGGVVGGLFGRR